MKKQIIITGGLGFVGCHLIKKLLNKNFFPIIVDNLSNANLNILKELPKKSFAFIKADINEKEVIIKKLKKFNPEIIIHLAAIHYIPYCANNPKTTRKTNLTGTISILKIAQIKNIKKFIFLSSAAVYSPSNKNLKETNKTIPTEIYGKTKLEAEKKIKECSLKNNMQYTILRSFNIYGPNDLTPHFIPSVLNRLKKSNSIKVGNINTARDFVYVDDLIDILFKIIKRGKMNKKTYNVGTGKATTGKEIIKIIEKIKKIKIIINNNSNLVREIDQKSLVADIKKISNDYNWNPKYFINNGIKKLIKYYEINK